MRPSGARESRGKLVVSSSHVSIAQRFCCTPSTSLVVITQCKFKLLYACLRVSSLPLDSVRNEGDFPRKSKGKRIDTKRSFPFAVLKIQLWTQPIQKWTHRRAPTSDGETVDCARFSSDRGEIQDFSRASLFSPCSTLPFFRSSHF